MELCFEQSVLVPRAALFAFHSTPANLALLLEGWSGFEMLEHAGHIRPGSRVRVAQRVAGLRHEMCFEHFVLEPPARFGERQVDGPFERFEHVHEFTELGAATRIVDRVSFELPLHLGGRAAERWIAAPTLRRFFEFRRGAYQRLAAAGRLR